MKVPFAILALGLAGCAPMDGPMDTASSDVAPCLRTGDVDNFRVASDRQAYVHSRRGGSFRLDTVENCFEPTTRAVHVEPDVSVSPQMCTGDRVRVQVQMNSSVPRTCIATITGPITGGDVSGLPG